MSQDSGMPYTTQVIQVKQPLGTFYVASIPARLLLKVAYSDPASVIPGEPYRLENTQRTSSKLRVREIEEFIETAEAAFPNAIILAANYNRDGILVDDDTRWQIIHDDVRDVNTLVIPTETPLASIVDGQHRWRGFFKASDDRQSMELLCVVYLDLPEPYQAYIFATINFNQKKVDKSLAYELFGFDLEDEPEDSWSPDKTAVLIARKLNTTVGSPLYGHIAIAAQDDEILTALRENAAMWKVSMATVVDGLCRLFSTNPKRDKYLMHRKTITGGRTRRDLSDDSSPVRQLYISVNDLAIQTAVENYFRAVDTVFWKDKPMNSYIRKTVGIQALFDVLKDILANFNRDKNISVTYFERILMPCSGLDFTRDVQASGIGRAKIRESIRAATGVSAT